MKTPNLIILVLAGLLITGAFPLKAQSVYVYNANGIKVYPKINTDPFPKATLKLLTPDEAIRPGNNHFEYAVEAYGLKEQSPSAKTNNLANSKGGQHIHFIVDNKPYQAKYEPSFEAQLEPETHLVLAFLSRSFHESVKSKNAFVLKQYQLNNGKPVADIKKDPLLFYSRPKGTYSIENGDKVLLDFFLVNTKLRKNGHKVRVNLDGHSFTLDKWQPYLIEGLSIGDHRIEITLIDAKGVPIPGPFNKSGTRTFTLK
ncbi:hypothetical protein QQ020_00275 [Fulvivirgaceae bacterium BMA12]|uniref:Phosphopeptide-binding protein n=1 Tax=Agaribacillus aureus TaxID=3051825 RepID=A0ABT8KYD3_9BACT|nr:hypothetical protein [Fulvivirgaceae bacterium BMA12]